MTTSTPPSWPLHDELPDGYWFDRETGSPLPGYAFAINGSPLKGGKRILVKINRPSAREP